LDLRRLCPAFLDDDSPETITAGVTLGLQHPPGYALAALWVRCWSLLSLGNPCFSVNLGSAFLGALSTVLLARIILEVLAGFSTTKRRDLIPALVGALLFGLSRTFWEKSLGAKGSIYLLGTLLVLLLILCSFRHGKGTPRWLFLGLFLFGVGFGNHWETLVIFFPLFAAFLLVKGRFAPPSTRSVAMGVSFLILGASCLLFLPLRAHQHPFLDLGAPDSWGLFIADFFRRYTAGRETGVLKSFFDYLLGKAPWSQWTDLIHIIASIQGRQIPAHLWDQMGPAALGLALLGAFHWWRNGDKGLFLRVFLPGFFLLAALCSAAWIPPGPQALWYVDNFLMPLNWMTALLAAVGAWFLLDRFPKNKVLPILFLVLPLSLWSAGKEDLDLEQQTARYDYGVNLLRSLPSNALFFSEADEDYFPLFYLQGVAHLRPDVRALPTFTLFETWGWDHVTLFYPELGLGSRNDVLDDPYHRIEAALGKLMAQDRSPVGFSRFDGAFHRYYLKGLPAPRTVPSGIVLLFDGPATHGKEVLAPGGLRMRHFNGVPSDRHPSLTGIWSVYRTVGVVP
jgi:hypothetical protein